MDSPACYRYDTAREYAADLKERSEQYYQQIKKYNRRITAIDVAVYSVSGVMAGAGIVLSSVTMIAPIAVPIAISAVTTLAGIATAITRRLSSCLQRKLHKVFIGHSIAFNAYSKVSELISTSIDDSTITDIEFLAISAVYNSAMSKLERHNNNDNNNVTRTASANRGEHHSDSNKHDIDNLIESRI